MDLGHYFSGSYPKDWVVMEDIALVEERATGSMVKEIVLRKEYDTTMGIAGYYKNYSKDKNKKNMKAYL